MAATDLIDDHVSAKQCKLAVDALLKHEKRRTEKAQDSQLLPGKEQHVWLQITVKQMHAEKKLKPHRIPVAHPIVDPRTSPVCLITKDPQREYKDLLEANNIKFISRVVGVTKLKGKFKPFEARRLLLKENDLFLADERVVPLLPGLLGKKFFEAKKQPIPVCLTRKDLKGELERAINSTYFHQNQGTCSSIKVGTISQSPAHILDNLKTALPAVAKAIKGNWDNIQSLHIKTSTSTSLPIWTCELGADAGGRWDGLVAQDASEAGSDVSASDDEDEAEEPAVEVKKAAKGKKRAAEPEDEQPKKKAKPSSADAAPSKAKGPAPTEGAGAAKGKKRKAGAEDSVAPEPAPTPTPTKDGKKKRNAAPAPSSSTPTAAAKKAARATATDFFDEEFPAGGVAPPPNTPATALKAGAQTRSRKAASAAAAAAAPTAVSGAIAKLAGDAQEGGKVAKKEKKPKAAAAAKSADHAADAGAQATAKKSAGKAAPDAAAVSVADVKRKVGAPGLEKKKEKALKAKRSAKEALIGKKGL